MLEGCCCFGIRALRLVPDCHFRNRLHRLFTHDEARIAANIVKLPELLHKPT